MPADSKAAHGKMGALSRDVALLAASLWVGGLWAIGYLAAPVLFKSQPDKQLAGMLAGNMFTLIAYVGMVCAAYLLLQQLAVGGRAAFRQAAFLITATMLLLTLAGQFGIQPLMAELKALALPLDVMHSAYAERFKLLHGAASLLYLSQSLLGAWLLLKMKRC